ncbi:MAG: PolC-type DNA polymerase III [Lachnospiraceae bacterium]|nr:PolC-type DNA polymerase III [Lachnospiraceae bacterium]
MEVSTFFQVFEGCEVPGGLRRLFDAVEVSKVVLKSKEGILEIRATAPHIISFDEQRQMERYLQAYMEIPTPISLRLDFRLTGRYSLQALYEAYESSIEQRIAALGNIERNIFQKCKIGFPEDGNSLHLIFEEFAVVQEKATVIVKTLSELFANCFHREVNVYGTYEQKEKKTRIPGLETVVVAKATGNVEGLATDIDTKQKETLLEDKKTREQKKRAEAGTDRKTTAPTRSQFRGYGSGKRKTNNPNIIWGNDTDGEVLPIYQVNDPIGVVVVVGKILTVEIRELRNERFLLIGSLTDFTDTISFKLFLQANNVDEAKEIFQVGSGLKMKAVADYDSFSKEVVLQRVAGVEPWSIEESVRTDEAASKRVELHCHTKMSEMDGICDAKAVIKQAIAFGHKAIAITDHGVVQAFPEASHAVPKGSDFKVIYGLEGYLVDDQQLPLDGLSSGSLQDAYVVFDIETTGFSPIRNKIIEIGAVKVEGGRIVDTFSTFVNPQEPIPFEIQELTKIHDYQVVDAPLIEEALPRFLDFCAGCILVAHNASFDTSFIKTNAGQLGLPYDFGYIDTVGIARILLPQLGRYRLNTVAKALNIPLKNHHRAVEDAAATAEIWVRFIEMFAEKGIETIEQIIAGSALSKESIRKLPAKHIILLAATEAGRVNLYRLVSASHLDYFHTRPKIPRSLLMQHREGLLLGSACEAGELYQAILDGRDEATLERIAGFYDYLEIQPLANNEFLLRENRLEGPEELKNINRHIVALGERLGKPVVATCDVHFLKPEDAIYREIIMQSKSKSGDRQPPLFLRNTQEMLDEFAYLGSEKAYEVVVENSNRIADLCERISPVRPDKCPPVLENSEEDLRNMCYDKAHAIYGEELPEVVAERLERELNSIISNGFAVMYIIAQKLVHKSNEDGYLVGSRGSVGSSFVATMSGITEVNPLPPHYYCASCHYSEFSSERVRAFAGGCGCDMPDAVCPQCGAPLKKEGFDIPFETFLGFKGNKEPDIDLNFSGDYQSKAHKYTEVIFGEGQTFRAGTIGTLAEKTAYGYVKHYFEEHGVTKREAEVTRLARELVGIRRTSGQHPGGIIVLPHGEEIHSFTPVQHPANDMKTDIITTHFDYHSIDHNLLKLDILGHDDPTMIRMLEDLTQTDAKAISLDDKDVMSLFAGTEILGIEPEAIDGCQLGCLGIPEFGTDFVIQMVLDTKPQFFGDLVRISGLSHGTDVWLGNAQKLILEGNATIATAICTRDDIMTYLINQGMDSELSFTIMESVRKGKGLRPEWEEAMREAAVPEWYIWSCKKIKYMFPKAHAAAYVMMAFRIAYYKIHYPLAYYCAYFTIRASAFNYELMCQGKEVLEAQIAKLKSNKDGLTEKEKNTLKDMKIVQEMYARGFGFHRLDVYRAKAKQFQILDGKLMAAISTIEGLGETAAEAVEAAAVKPFLSLEDFKQRTKVSQKVIDTMVELGILSGLPQSNQLSLFEMLG